MFGKYNWQRLPTPSRPEQQRDGRNGRRVGEHLKYGLRSSEHTPVSAIADKLEIEYSGFKTVPTALPKHLQFKLAP